MMEYNNLQQQVTNRQHQLATEANQHRHAEQQESAKLPKPLAVTVGETLISIGTRLKEQYEDATLKTQQVEG